jgi:hypothetical protein
MQITIHLHNARQYSFAIADGQASADFFETVKYWEVFDRPILRVQAGTDTSAINPATIEKIHFLTTEDPGWGPPENIIFSKCISQETYQRKLAILDTKPTASDAAFQAGNFAEVVLEIALVSGAAEYFETRLMLRQRREQMINLYYLFQKVGYPIPCENGGFVMFNPRHIVCIHMRPSPPENPDSAWLVDKLSQMAS